ncbi:MAG: hypothetical protein V3S24_01990, partial [Candidatus Tectomicrobia bacterium]
REGSWLTGELAEFLPRHRRSQGRLAHGLYTRPLAHAFGTLRLLKPDEQETSFRLLLDVKNIPRPPVRQDDPLFGIDFRYAHSGIIPHGLSAVKDSDFNDHEFFKHLEIG